MPTGSILSDRKNIIPDALLVEIRIYGHDNHNVLTDMTIVTFLRTRHRREHSDQEVASRLWQRSAELVKLDKWAAGK